MQKKTRPIVILVLVFGKCHNSDSCTHQFISPVVCCLSFCIAYIGCFLFREEEEEIQRMSESSTLKIRKFSLTLSTLLKYT